MSEDIETLRADKWRLENQNKSLNAQCMDMHAKIEQLMVEIDAAREALRRISKYSQEEYAVEIVRAALAAALLNNTKP